MRDLSKPYRLAVAAAIAGISVPVYDEKRWVQSTEQQFVILSTQQQTPSPGNENDCTWISQCGIDIEIYDKTGSEVSKDTMDDIANEILTILLPAPFQTPLTSGNLQFTNAYCESIISRNLSISETESVLVKVVRFVCQIIEQN